MGSIDVTHNERNSNRLVPTGIRHSMAILWANQNSCLISGLEENSKPSLTCLVFSLVVYLSIVLGERKRAAYLQFRTSYFLSANRNCIKLNHKWRRKYKNPSTYEQSQSEDVKIKFSEFELTKINIIHHKECGGGRREPNLLPSHDIPRDKPIRILGYKFSEVTPYFKNILPQNLKAGGHQFEPSRGKHHYYRWRFAKGERWRGKGWTKAYVTVCTFSSCNPPSQDHSLKL